MTDPERRDRLRVSAMIEAAEEARRDASGGSESFVQADIVQKAVLIDLIHLTESADRTSTSLKKLNPRVPWERLNRLRNHGPVHEYIEVDLDDLWAFVRVELPRLRRRLERIVYPLRSERQSGVGSSLRCEASPCPASRSGRLLEAPRTVSRGKSHVDRVL